VLHTDLFATFLALTDLRPPKVPEESLGFATLLADAHAPYPRDHAYSEIFVSRRPDELTGCYDRAVRGERFKLIRLLGEPDALYDLRNDPRERDDLMEEDGPLPQDASAVLPQLETWMNTYEGLGQ